MMKWYKTHGWKELTGIRFVIYNTQHHSEALMLHCSVDGSACNSADVPLCICIALCLCARWKRNRNGNTGKCKQRTEGVVTNQVQKIK